MSAIDTKQDTKTRLAGSGSTELVEVLALPITCIVATPYLGVYAHHYGHILCVECEFACTIPISEVFHLGANTHPRWRAVLRHRGGLMQVSAAQKKHKDSLRRLT
jgi:hypothetical protein